MFAKQTVLSASLVAWLGASARAQPEAPEQADDEVSAPGTVEPTPVEPTPVEKPAAAKPAPTKPTPAPPPKRKPTGSFQIGAGFSSDESFIATAKVEQTDLFGTGLYLGLTARISALRNLALLRFADPDLFGSRFALTADLYSEERLMPGFKRRANGTSVSVSHPLGRNVHAYLGYRLEAIEVESLIVARSPEEPAPQLRGGLFSAVRAGITYDTRDEPYVPTRGSSFGAEVERADHRLGSDFNQTRLRAWATTHQALGPFTLHLGGSITAIADSSGVPLNERLFLDSSREVRGFRAYTLGPVDALGRPIGGDTKLIGRAELELPIWRRAGLSAVGFLDAGAVIDRSTGQGERGLSVGFGLLWRSPIGPLRFDWAFPLDGGGPVFGVAIGGGF